MRQLHAVLRLRVVPGMIVAAASTAGCVHPTTRGGSDYTASPQAMAISAVVLHQLDVGAVRGVDIVIAPGPLRRVARMDQRAIAQLDSILGGRARVSDPDSTALCAAGRAPSCMVVTLLSYAGNPRAAVVRTLWASARFVGRCPSTYVGSFRLRGDNGSMRVTTVFDEGYGDCGMDQ